MHVLIYIKFCTALVSRERMKNTLITLAEIHYDLGLIGHNEYCERIDIALWLSGQYDSEDPRELPQGYPPTQQEVLKIQGNSRLLSHPQTEEKFLCMGYWIFTKSDAESYPSVPFGFYKNPKQQWPKLDPYTGRVYNAKHQENVQQRLSKADLEKLWSDESLKSLCREITVWYQEQFRSYTFPVRNHLRMPKSPMQ